MMPSMPPRLAVVREMRLDLLKRISYFSPAYLIIFKESAIAVRWRNNQCPFPDTKTRLVADAVFYSYFKLSTGFAVAAFIA